MMKAKDGIKQFTLKVSLDFTKDDMEFVSDLGCVFFCRLKKYLAGEEIKAYMVVNKKTQKPIKLQNPNNAKEGDFLLKESFITSPNESNPQDGYFILRFEKSRCIWCYSPKGKVLFEASGGHGPVIRRVVHCGKNEVITNTTNSFENKQSFTPIKEIKLDL